MPIRKNIHFYISIPVVLVVALVYGFHPGLLFEISPNSSDEHNVYKAIMGLYLAFVSFWFWTLFYPNYWRTATISNVLFMLGLAFGRLLSFIFDGWPSVLFMVGFLGELTLALYGCYLLKKSN